MRALSALTEADETLPEAVEAIVNAPGLLPCVVQALGVDEPEELQRAGAEVATSVACSPDSAHVQALVFAGALPVLVRFLEVRANSPVADNVLRCLGNVATYGPELAKAIVDTWLASAFDPKGSSAANVEAINKLDGSC
jgi:hypothetical protein